MKTKPKIFLLGLSLCAGLAALLLLGLSGCMTPHAPGGIQKFELRVYERGELVETRNFSVDSLSMAQRKEIDDWVKNIYVGATRSMVSHVPGLVFENSVFQCNFQEKQVAIHSKEGKAWRQFVRRKNDLDGRVELLLRELLKEPGGE